MDLRMRGGAILAHLASFLTFLFVLTMLTQQIQSMGFGGYLRPEASAAEREMKTALDLQALKVAGQAAFANFRHTFLE